MLLPLPADDEETETVRKFASSRVPWLLLVDEFGLYVDVIVHLTTSKVTDETLAHYDDLFSGLRYTLDNTIPFMVRCHVDRFRVMPESTTETDPIREHVDRAQARLVDEMEKNDWQEMRRLIEACLDQLLPDRDAFDIEISDRSDWLGFPEVGRSHPIPRAQIDFLS